MDQDWEQAEREILKNNIIGGYCLFSRTSARGKYSAVGLFPPVASRHGYSVDPSVTELSDMLCDCMVNNFCYSADRWISFF